MPPARFLRSSADLLARVRLSASAPSILHLGCGCGSSTQLLLDKWPGASLRGVDQSSQLLTSAQEQIGAVTKAANFVLSSVEELVDDGLRGSADAFDLIFWEVVAAREAPATLQKLLASVRPGGVLAMLNEDSSPHERVNNPTELLKLRGPLCSELDLWSSTYQARRIQPAICNTQ